LRTRDSWSSWQVIYQEIDTAHLAQASRVANYKSRVVVIHASSGAVATKLRQMAPTLATELSKRGLECTSVQVKVHARHRP
jgi:predicted nucleic acid-binding Zn ribbon protein